LSYPITPTRNRHLESEIESTMSDVTEKSGGDESLSPVNTKLGKEAAPDSDAYV
jgi:hypothetical protein